MVLNWRGVKSRLYSGKRRIDGRNKGLIAIRARGGALKRKYRYIEHYKQKWMDKWLFVMRIEYDPNRSAHIALCSILKEGIYFYVISVAKLEVGSLIITSNLKQGILQVGYTTKIKNIPEGILINNIELMENSGSKLSRAAGTSSLIIKQYNKKYSLVKLSSKECRLISNECYATIGTVSNIEKKIKKSKKASESRKKGIRPIVRGLAMNPVDHPHGGRTKGGMHWKSFSGKLAYNISSRKKTKMSSRYIIIGHRKQRLMDKKKKNG
uniref:Large ribosomal subunit protein uL2m n=1 Tax=Dictyostelium citrinum TaxID=361072 RepID=RM02_DICCI|nr:ribosomal protein L12 [Dictyostelium citrinum]Q2LCR9.1 RecName: Full=Large ribosomal subunit protein uL2m; AltName: Full=60S ribosomal protein L2, mitochondrial [Dictyostelium citrinum]ABC60374.1 ribosomal protein L12 [Dictyostelium citrinum]